MRLDESLLTEGTAGVQPVRREQVLMPEAVEKRICRGQRADLRSQIAAGLRADPGTQARIACSSGPTPMIAITRLML